MLKRKTAIVTGASRGIGRAIALNLASQGVNIVLNYRNDVEAMQEVIKEIEAKGVRVVAIKGDVSDFKQAENIIKAATESW